MNNVGDSIDDIINLLSKHYQPKQTTNPQSKFYFQPPRIIREKTNTSQKKSQSVNPKRVTSSKEQLPLLRYLTFKPYSGKQIDNIPDYGYYYKFGSAPIKLIKGALEENGFKETQDKNWTIYWSSSSIKVDVYQNLFAYQKVSHFPKSHEMTRKDLMHRNISKMQINHGFVNFNFIPKTFILPAEMSYFLEEHEKIKNSIPIYICKPHASSQGKGIFITDKIQDILNKQNPNMSYVVSYYIDKPLLINNLKFDLRVYVAITCINPLRIYVYEDGLARFATEPYSLDSIKGNRFGHLTNYSVNKESPNFVANNDPSMDHVGSKWSLLSLREYLKLNKINDVQVFERIDDMIIKTVLSVESIIYQACEMHVPYRSSCFSLFGFDVLVDQQLKPWLLEVNHSPSLNIDAPIDLKIKGDMIADLFTLIGIVPLDQRYSNEIQYMKGQIKSDPDKFIIRECEDETKRSRGWKRVYPNENSQRYQKYFEIDRQYNSILRNYYK